MSRAKLKEALEATAAMAGTGVQVASEAHVLYCADRLKTVTDMMAWPTDDEDFTQALRDAYEEARLVFWEATRQALASNADIPGISMA